VLYFRIILFQFCFICASFLYFLFSFISFLLRLFLEDDIDASFSTFHVFNHLLCAQANDLIKIGIDSVIKSVILNIWSKYLRKLGIAFHSNKETLDSKLNKSNIKWKRLNF